MHHIPTSAPRLAENIKQSLEQSLGRWSGGDRDSREGTGGGGKGGPEDGSGSRAAKVTGEGGRAGRERPRGDPTSDRIISGDHPPPVPPRAFSGLRPPPTHIRPATAQDLVRKHSPVAICHLTMLGAAHCRRTGAAPAQGGVNVVVVVVQCTLLQVRCALCKGTRAE